MKIVFSDVAIFPAFAFAAGMLVAALGLVILAIVLLFRAVRRRKQKDKG